MKPEISEPGDFYTQQTYQVQVIGLYHDIGNYLASIASGPRIVTPVELRLKPRGGTEVTRDGTPRLNAEFRIITYVIPPQAAMEEAAPGAAPAPATGGTSGQN